MREIKRNAIQLNTQRNYVAQISNLKHGPTVIPTHCRLVHTLQRDINEMGTWNTVTIGQTGVAKNDAVKKTADTK